MAARLSELWRPGNLPSVSQDAREAARISLFMFPGVLSVFITLSVITQQSLDHQNGTDSPPAATGNSFVPSGRFAACTGPPRLQKFVPAKPP